MPADESDWRDDAKAIYQHALTELLSHSEPSADDMVEFYKEELREVLLDLKQAVIADRPADALEYIREVSVCLLELRK
jgi:hypothetical protein